MAGFESMNVKKSTIPSIVLTTANYAIAGGIAYFAEAKEGLKYADASDLKLAAIAISAYLYVLFVFLFRQGLGHNALNPQLVKSEDPAVQAHFRNLTRSALNAVEQAPAFLTAVVLYAGLVNPKRAGILAFAYTAFLVPYPVLFGKSFTPVVFVSTLPRYLMIMYMASAFTIAALRT
mmetsp:Transcript_2312/g.5168  ORF Transcript_2312/g.5168 Transcript_2312/m.5168 type:complete len:177 (-) Transcript_2312:196-726(-)